MTQSHPMSRQCFFPPEKEKLFATRFEEDYDIQDPEYTAWVKNNHPECCLSAASNSSVSASSDVNHKSPTSKMDATTPPKSGAMVSGTEATTSSEPLKCTASESDLSDILALPKPKEKSGRKRKPGINQKTVCLTYDAVFDRFKAEEQEKKDKELEKRERKRVREEKKAEKKRLKKEKGQKKETES